MESVDNDTSKSMQPWWIECNAAILSVVTAVIMWTDPSELGYDRCNQSKINSCSSLSCIDLRVARDVFARTLGQPRLPDPDPKYYIGTEIHYAIEQHHFLKLANHDAT
jgi:hypothetical protein